MRLFEGVPGLVIAGSSQPTKEFRKQSLRISGFWSGLWHICGKAVRRFR